MIAASPDDWQAHPIGTLFVNCSLRLRNFDQPGLAASDTCQAPADTAVEMDNGNLMWRCPVHRSMRTMSGPRGAVVTHIRDKLPS